MGMAMFHPSKIIFENFFSSPEGRIEAVSALLPLGYALYIKATRPHEDLSLKFKLGLWWYAVVMPCALSIFQYYGLTLDGHLSAHRMTLPMLLFTLVGVIAADFLSQEGMERHKHPKGD